MIEWFVSLPFGLQILIIVVVVGGALTVLGMVVGKALSRPSDYNWMEDLDEKLKEKKNK